MPSAARLLSLVMVSSGSMACQDPLPPIRYETEQALIGTGFGDPLCGYDLPWIDEQIEFAEGMLDAASSDKVEIYLYGDAPEFCGHEGVSGCYNPERDIVVSAWWAVDHEIVHAVVDRFADSPPFWDEGVAEALRLHRPTVRGYVPIEDNVRVGDTSQVERFSAGHFTRWLIDNHGTAALKRVLRGTSTEDAFGGSLETLAAQYEAEAPEAYPSYAPCDYPPLRSTGPEQWSESVEVSCERPDVTRFSERKRTLLRSVELEGGRYTFEVHGTQAWGQLLGCLTEPRYEPVGSMMHGATMSELEHSLTAPGIRFEAGMVHTLELTEGLYTLAIPVDEDGEHVEVSLARIE
ncbi:MAG: hypothetical protein AB1Z98_24270 [Nannocystaceae bacterium]